MNEIDGVLEVSPEVQKEIDELVEEISRAYQIPKWMMLGQEEPCGTVQAIASWSGETPTINLKESMIGKPLEINGKKVGKITSVRRVEKEDDNIKTEEFSFESQIVEMQIDDDEVMRDIVEGKHKNISIGSNLEQSYGVGENSIE